MSNANNITARTKEQAVRFASEYGVQTELTDSTISLLPVSDWSGTVDELDMSQGALVDPANTAGLYWDYEQYGAPYGEFPNDCTESVTGVEETDHDGVPSFYLTSEGRDNDVLMGRDLLLKVNEVFNIDVVENHSRMNLLPDTYSSPVKISDPIPTSETFVLVAPRIQ
jgi:hypothetical protein